MNRNVCGTVRIAIFKLLSTLIFLGKMFLFMFITAIVGLAYVRKTSLDMYKIWTY